MGMLGDFISGAAERGADIMAEKRKAETQFDLQRELERIRADREVAVADAKAKNEDARRKEKITGIDQRVEEAAAGKDVKPDSTGYDEFGGPGYRTQGMTEGEKRKTRAGLIASEFGEGEATGYMKRTDPLTEEKEQAEIDLRKAQAEQAAATGRRLESLSGLQEAQTEWIRKGKPGGGSSLQREKWDAKVLADAKKPHDSMFKKFTAPGDIEAGEDTTGRGMFDKAFDALIEAGEKPTSASNSSAAIVKRARQQAAADIKANPKIAFDDAYQGRLDEFLGVAMQAKGRKPAKADAATAEGAEEGSKKKPAAGKGEDEGAAKKKQGDNPLEIIDKKIADIRGKIASMKASSGYRRDAYNKEDTDAQIMALNEQLESLKDERRRSGGNPVAEEVRGLIHRVLN